MKRDHLKINTERGSAGGREENEGSTFGEDEVAGLSGGDDVWIGKVRATRWDALRNEPNDNSYLQHFLEKCRMERREADLLVGDSNLIACLLARFNDRLHDNIYF